MKKKTASPAATPSPVETQALNTSTSQLGQQNQQLQNVNSTVAGAQAPLNRITQMDANGSTPLRKSLTTGLTSSTNTAYDNAAAATRLKGLQAGLANQPMQVGNEAALENKRAEALGHIPAEVEQQASGEELQAGGLQNALANTQLGVARTYNPESYFSAGAGLEGGRESALNQQYMDEQQRRGGLWKGLARVGLAAAAPFTGGASGWAGSASGAI